MKSFAISDKSIKIFSADRNVHLSFSEKMRIAGCLDDMNTDIIEFPAPQTKTDEMLVKTASVSLKKSALAVDTGFTAEGVDKAYECAKDAVKPILNVSFPVSVVQMEYICHMKPAVVLSAISSRIKEAKAKGVTVEFSAEDAGRAEAAFLYSAVSAAIEAGADIVSVSDEAAGFSFEEYGAFISALYENVPALKEKQVIVDISNEIDMATASLYTAVKAGVDGVKVAVGADAFCDYSKTIDFLTGKGDALGINISVNTAVVRKNTGDILAAVVPVESETAHEIGSLSNDVFLTESADEESVGKTLDTMGYALTDADKKAVYSAFILAAQKKKTVSSKELDAIVASVAMQVPSTYELVSYVFTSGNLISATANIVLEKDGKAMTGVAAGDGPVDASFNAIETIIGHHYELDDFQVQAVTEGRQALGRAVVCLRSASGKLFSGSGISTDVIGASIRAYVNALNKIAFEENR